MTEKQLIKEFARWIDAGRPAVWYKSTTSNPRWLASGRQNTCWKYSDTIYIVDDDHAELRKLQIDKPDTKFEWFAGQEWHDCKDIPNWDLETKYRVKPTEWYEDPDMVGKPVWARDIDDGKWNLDIFEKYVSNNICPYRCKSYAWVHAKPVEPEDLYAIKE